MATEVGSGMEFMGNLAGFVLVFQHWTCKMVSSGGRRINGQATEPIYMHLGLPRVVFHHEVILLQCGRPAVEKSGSRSHRLQPLQSVVVM